MTTKKEIRKAVDYLNDAHSALAKSNLSARYYDQISQSLLEAKQILNTELQASQQKDNMPTTEEMRDKYTDLREKHGLYEAFNYFHKWLKSQIKP